MTMTELLHLDDPRLVHVRLDDPRPGGPRLVHDAQLVHGTRGPITSHPIGRPQ
jgi:hypothetical protein